MQDVKLYHGSRNGIVGSIVPCSRARCDFGKGFYMGTRSEQVKTLIYKEVSPKVYVLNLRLSEIDDDKVLVLSDMGWAYYVLYNRGRLESAKGTKFYQSVAAMGNGKEIIIGPIADDNMGMIMRQFANGDITDKAMLECIRCIDYGTQYVAKTEEACLHIEICHEEKLDVTKLDEYHRYREALRQESEQKVKAIKRRFRGEGKYLDLILEEQIVLSKREKLNTSTGCMMLSEIASGNLKR
jgi:hypothetical protein